MFVLSVHPQDTQAEGRVITDSDNMGKEREYRVKNPTGGASGHYMQIKGTVQVVANADDKGKL